MPDFNQAEVKTKVDARQGAGPRDNLKVLIASLAILAVIAAIIFGYFGLLPGGEGLGQSIR